MELTLAATTILERNYEEYLNKIYRIIINEGGTGSSKTYSLAQLWLLILLNETDAQLTVARKTLPALRATAMKDFFTILKFEGLYKEEFHNKSENTYNFRGNQVDFLSVDEPTRIRSRRRNYLWLNEANEFTLEDYRQLSLRTEKQIFLDYNPSYLFHWIYDELQTRKDCIVIPSTYKDNPFLNTEVVREIERYKSVDENYWRIYGLGLKGFTQTLVYTHWQFCDNLPDSFEHKIFGLDFGYNNPTAFLEIRIKDRDAYWKEHLYQSSLTNQQLIEKLKECVKNGILTYNDLIIADSAEPQRIEEIRQAGFNIESADKDVKKGIDDIKSHKLFITKDSVNLLKEVKSYSWRQKDGKVLDEPIKANDHLLDGGRYAQHYLTVQEEPNIIII